MSSPFATFRKNRQFWMASLVLLAILAFVVAPAIDMVGNAFRDGGVDNTVVVSWDGGRMTRSEVEVALQKRNQVLNFLRALGKKVIEYGGEPAVPGFSRSPSGEIVSLGIDETLSPDRVCLSRIFSTQASRMGVQFDDRAADEFLLSFCDGKIADEEFYDILRSNTGGLTIYDVRDQIKQDLAFLVVRNLAGGINAARPPATTWRDFLKLNQTAKVEAFPVYVHDHVSKVQALPDESQIQEIFEEGRNRLPNSYSEVPGFVRPAKAKAEFVESRFQDWIEKEKPAITEEEIKAEYDRLISIGQLQVPITEDAAPSSEVSPEAGATTEPSSSVPATTDAGAATEAVISDSQPPAPEGTSSEAGTENSPDEDASPEASLPTADTPEPSSAEPTTSEPLNSGNDGDSGNDGVENAGNNPANGNGSGTDNAQKNPRFPSETRLVAYFQEESAEKQEEATQDAVGASPAESGQAEPEESPAVQPVENSGSSVTDEQTGIATTEPTAPSVESPPPPKMRTKTLEESREQIIEDLAKIKARSKAMEVLTSVQKLMKDYYLAYRQFQAFKEAKVDDATAPIRPDLKKFAEENGLIYGETDLADSTQLATTSLGQSSVFIEMRRAGTASELLPLPQIELFAPLMSGLSGSAQNEFKEFYFWKVDGRPAAEPQLSDVREEVIAAWKKKQAWSLTETAAKELSAKVGNGEDPWATALAETLRPLVITTDPFPWLARMGMGGQGGISTTFVPKLDGVGEEFMQQVFSSEVGKVGVAPNQAKSVYYVFRVIEKLPSLEELQERFESDQMKQGPMAVAQEEQALSEDIWLRRVFSELNVDFKSNVQ